MSAIAERRRFGAYKILPDFNTFEENLTLNSVKNTGRSRHRIDAGISVIDDEAGGGATRTYHGTSAQDKSL
jgi:hypothetical protein